ncbi:hypothetical protein K491DRAFT_713718 [Lophiostoma macrostomum CBS 122681]|uniref:RING-type domain-containing protein n=1 Tax=Lophiostoma macrostomum CBS 122681 TaxID=1314788 RepID=A0A6A6TF29_9PLEO|nr:hypothetical protein K491DRAFT_713718 [Lophiostoma macrostomum CBS 122681]
MAPEATFDCVFKMPRNPKYKCPRDGEMYDSIHTTWYCKVHDPHRDNRCQVFCKFQGIQRTELASVTDSKTHMRYCETHSPLRLVNETFSESTETCGCCSNEDTQSDISSNSNKEASRSKTDVKRVDYEENVLPELVTSNEVETDKTTGEEECLNIELTEEVKLPKVIALLPGPTRVLSPVIQRTFSPPQVDPLDDLHPVEVVSTPLVRKESKRRAKRVTLPTEESPAKSSPLRSGRVLTSISIILKDRSQGGDRIAPMYFLCNICLENHSTSDMCSIDECGHLYSEHCVASTLRTSGQRRYNCTGCQNWLAQMYLKSCQKWLEEDLHGKMP